MIVFAYYLAKLIICSGIFIFYYLLFLKNRKFHQWNRFYLLSVILLSVVIPLINIPVTHVNNDLVNTRIQLLNIVQSTNNYLDEITIGAQNSSSIDLWLILSYIFISLISALFFIRSLINIKSFIRSYKIHSLID